jgi:LysM repeat protein
MPLDMRRRRIACSVTSAAGCVWLGACVLLPAPVAGQALSGSQASLDRQNRRAAGNDYSFLRTPAEIRRFVAAGLLVRLEGNRDYTLNAVSYPVARPEVRLFVERLASQYHDACGEPLVVTSLTRPQSDQPANASSRSVHPTGMAIDLRRPGNPRCRAWLERTLLALEGQRVVEATRETSPPHFHVAVFPTRYVQYVAQLTSRPASAVLAQARGATTYVVRRADTLWDLARQFGTSIDALRDANGLTTDRIHPGQVLEIPASSDGGS